VTVQSARARSAALVPVIAIVAVLLIKLSVLLELGRHPLLLPNGALDDGFYAHLADSVVQGDLLLGRAASFAGHPPPVFPLAPLYVYVLAILLKLSGGSVTFVRTVQILLGTAGVGLLTATARRWYGDAAARWTMMGAALFGLASFFELLILPVALDPFLTALDVYLLGRAAERDTTSAWALAGAALGLHALNRPNMVLVLGAFAVLLVARTFTRGRTSHAPGRAVTLAVTFALAGLVVIAPATWRNWRVGHEFAPISTPAGLDVLIGNGPEADGSLKAVQGVEPTIAGRWLEAPAVASRALGHAASAGETSRYFLNQALDWIHAHPLAEPRLLAIKARLALAATFLPVTHSFPFFSRDVIGALTMCFVGPVLVVPLGLAALVGARPRERQGYWLWAMYVPLSLISMVVFYVTSPLRLPLQVALLVPAGGGVAWIVERVRARAWGRLAPSALAVAVLALIVGWPTGRDDGRAEEQVRMALLDIRTGLGPEGDAWLAKALPHHPNPAGVYLRVGELYETMNRPADAIVQYHAGLAVAPADGSLRFGLGRAMFSAGQDSEAVAELQQARPGPQGDAATRVLVLALSRLGRRDEANRTVQTLDPSRWNADQAREFAIGLVNVGRVDLSVTAWKRAAEAGGDPQDYERLGLTWAMLGRTAEAIGPFEEAVRRSANSSSMRLNYAVALSSVGRRDDAIREAQTAIDLDPKNDKARAFLESLTKK
jgi:tetratricopeptide (TPR) repeat protein